MKSKSFINPYNFVPLEESCIRKSLAEYCCSEEPLLTGYMDCKLDTLTPLIIPNTSNDKAMHRADEERVGKSYDFFSYANLEFSGLGAAMNRYEKPVIPGSALRGVIRSVYETAFNGCLSTVDLNRKMHRRITKPKKAGLLRRNAQGGWEVVKCERVKIEVTLSKFEFGHVSINDYEKWKENELISVKRNRNKVAYQVEHGRVYGNGWNTGHLHKGEPFGEKTNVKPLGDKKYESVFVRIKPEKVLSVSDDEWRRFKELLRQYADDKLNLHIGKGHSGYRKYCELVDKAERNGEKFQLPVYYQEQDNEKDQVAMFLTPAMISKEVFQTEIGQLLRDSGGYQPCDERDMLCPACALFGMAGERSLASRVRFTDANVSGDIATEYYFDDFVLPELGEPKPGTVEFYSVFPEKVKSKPNMQYPYWTYDYIADGDKVRLLEKNKLKIRGRKFYWHHEPVQETIDNSNSAAKSGDDLNNMKQRVRAVAAGTTFSFRVYFDSVTKEELARLYWALTFEDTGCAHKIGHGKPLGYGSATIQVTRIMIRQLDRETGERSLRDEKQRILQSYRLDETPSMALLKKIASWTNKPSRMVSYPLGEGNKNSGGSNNTASHQWFGINRKNKGFDKVLPTIEEELDEKASDKWLYKLKETAANTKPRHRRRK